jgi:hypothetical protein
MIFHEQPTDPWLPFDFKLLEAYQMLQDEICPKCGHPVWLCRSTSNRVEFKARAAVCYAERALREYEDQKKPRGEREKDRKVKASWGEFYYTQPFVPDNIEGELPTRDEFYSELAGKIEYDPQGDQQ